jgi:hypothetical protein
LCHLDPDVLRAALSRMLSEDDDGYLIYQLVVEGAEPAQVAAERGVRLLMLTEQLRDAIDQLAMEVEDIAYASVGKSKQERVRATLARCGAARVAVARRSPPCQPWSHPGEAQGRGWQDDAAPRLS